MSRRVLALWQPWASFTVVPSLTTGRRWKGVETRHFTPEKVQREITLPIDVAIHATKKWSPDLRQFCANYTIHQLLKDIGHRDPRNGYENGTPLPLGAIIGVATIVRVLPAAEWLALWATENPNEVLLGDYSVGRFGWELADQVDLDEPIPFSGRQDVLYELDPETNARIDAQLSGVSAEALSYGVRCTVCGQWETACTCEVA